MARFPSLSKRAAPLFVVGVFAVAAGCTQIFGFERPGDIVNCVHDSDCPGSPGQFVCLSNTCTFACVQPEDCHVVGFAPGTAACLANRCVPIGPLDAGGGDALTTETVDAPAEAAPATESGTPEASATCSPACQTFSYCDDASCLDFQDHGFPGPGPQMQGLVSDKLTSLKILPDVCGFLTGIGFVTINTVRDQRIRVGLYTDNSGVPDQLVAQTAPSTVIEGTNELPVETPALIGCDDVAPHYWIAGVWDDGLFSLEASAGEIVFQAETSSDTVGFAALLTRSAGDQIDAGLPSIFPTPAPPLMGVTAMPHVYVIVARTN